MCPTNLPFLCFKILSGPHRDIFLSQSTPCNGFGTRGGKRRCGEGGLLTLIAVYFGGKSLLGKTCI